MSLPSQAPALEAENCAHHVDDWLASGEQRHFRAGEATLFSGWLDGSGYDPCLDLVIS